MNIRKILSQWIGLVLFSKAEPLVIAAQRGSLSEEDAVNLPRDLDPKQALTDIDKLEWSTPRKLLISVFWLTKKRWLRSLAFYSGSILASLMSPVLIHAFLDGLTGGAPFSRVGFLGIGLGICGALSGILIQHYFYGILRLEQVAVNLVNTKIYDHTLKLSQGARQKSFVGDIVNHMSSDCDSVANIGSCVADALMTLLVTVGSTGLLFYYLGATAWAAVLVLALLVPLTLKVSKRFQLLDDQLMKHRDQRVTLIAQILGAIRLVKFFGWEKSLSQEVTHIRDRELAARRQLALAQMLSGLVYLSVTTVVLFVTLGAHVARGQDLTATVVFTSLALVNLLESPFGGLSELISRWAYARVGAERLTQYFSQTEVDLAQTLSQEVPIIELAGVTYCYPQAAKNSLGSVTLRIAAGESIAVVGEVGSGKSTLIQILLGEIKPNEGHVRFWNEKGEIIEPDFGYVSQEAYILNGTVRDNIMFGVEPRVDIMTAVNRACFAKDLAELTHGLDTEIGEHGVNLSGGQKQRLQLARAVAQDPRVVLLDDPISAVDPQTESDIVSRLILDHWKSRTRIVITHRLEHLAQFDRVLFLKEGQIVGFAPFQELLKAHSEFRAFYQDHGASQGSTMSQEAETLPVVSTLGDSHFTEEEDRASGSVSQSVYGLYLRNLGGGIGRAWKLRLAGLVLATWFVTLVPVLMNSWLAWSVHPEGLQWLTHWGLTSPKVGVWTAVWGYGILALISVASMMATNIWWMISGIEAGRRLHERMLASVMKARLRFFDSTPVGRVLQRFSRDTEAVDIHLQRSFEQTIHCFINVLTSLLVLVVALPVILVVVIPLAYLYVKLQREYRVPAREIKRLDSISRSPRYAHFKETLMGLPTIRAYRRQNYFMAEFFRRLARNQELFYNHYLLNRWFSSRIPLIGGVVAAASCSGTALAVHMNWLSPEFAGVLVIYALGFWGYLNWGIRIFSEVEAKLTSLERVEFFSSLEPEVDTIRVSDSPLEKNWPNRGDIEFENVKVRYAGHLPPVLKGVSFQIPAGSRVGLVGRTGSGKSTVVQCLFRFMELESGTIRIDGVDIASVPLERLRRSLAIIPQDPVLFMGTLKDNLDRTGEQGEEKIRAVLQRLGLSSWFDGFPLGLMTEVQEGGSNLSLGERQLVCLVRALLVDARVIVLDEATASVDVSTDLLLQRVLRKACQGRTMLTIAHRLGTIRDCDFWIELRDGRLNRIHQMTESTAETQLA